MTNKNIKLGKWGEEIASNYLSQKGYAIQAKNYRTEYGEIDLIVKNDQAIVFVEVKTRTGKKFGNPEEAITASKREHMINAANAYLQDNPDVNMDWRVDVISILVSKKSEPPEILHFENAVSG